MNCNLFTYSYPSFIVSDSNLECVHITFVSTVLCNTNVKTRAIINSKANRIWYKPHVYTKCSPHRLNMLTFHRFRNIRKFLKFNEKIIDIETKYI